MKTFVFVFLLLVSTIATAQSTVEINVPPGDLDALRLAMSEAAAGDPVIETIINTSGTFSFTDWIGLPDVHTRVYIKGNSGPITFLSVGGGVGPEQFVTTSEDGRLKFQNIEFKGFYLKGGGGLIQNRGTLELSQVQFDAVAGITICGLGLCSQNTPIIYNSASGKLHLDQVSLINSGVRAGPIAKFNRDGIIRNFGIADIQNTQIYFDSGRWSIPILNWATGILTLKNVSLFHSNEDKQFTNVPIKTDPEAKTYVSNTIISGFSGEWCETATSLGHNLVDTDQCNFNTEGDVIGEPAELAWQPVQSDWGWQATSLDSILNHAVVPASTSPAVDSINPALCPLGDLINNNGRLRASDGNGDGVELCDMGAVELQLDSEIELPPVHIADGGINGVYFDPDADGHYISIIDNDYNTLVMWNSFDKNGDQYFVHATGELVDGHSMIADAYVNVSGGTSPDGEILPAQAVYWGTLVIDMNSCNEGTLAFHSDLPEFGSGQVQLERIVFVKQLDCFESEPEEVVGLRPVTLAEGGINGVYFNPDADGHYISIIDTDYNTLVMWNSFDKDGKQYFVYGIGQLLEGHSLTASAYTNISGGTSPDGEILPAEAIHWGTLEVDMNSCNEGTLAFHSDLPEFGSGQVQLERIVFMKQLGCVD